MDQALPKVTDFLLQAWPFVKEVAGALLRALVVKLGIELRPARRTFFAVKLG